MDMSRSILLYGHDDVLLFTRRAILEKTGFRVFTASYLHEVEVIAATQPIDLLVLCQTVSYEERTKALSLVNSFKPDAVSFAMAEILPTYGGKASIADAGNFTSVRNFLAAVEEVIQRHEASSTAAR